VLFRYVLGVPFQVVTDKSKFTNNTNNPRINYSDKAIKGTIWIKPHTLLFETDLKEQILEVTHVKNTPCFFKTNELGKIKHDLFASSFYMLTRYEEYLGFTPDKHGRFSAQQTLAFKANFLHKPVVNLWANLLKKALQKQEPDYNFPTHSFKIHNTLDIDFAYKYKGKTPLIRFGSIIKSFFSFQFSELKQNFSVAFGLKDPFDVYDLLYQIQKERNIETTYFFQVGKYGAFDKNTPLKHTKSLIKRVSKYATVGIHPSYQSNNNKAILKNEVNKLSKVLGHSITKSRQHYLKLSFPTTYENLIEMGITEDYTLGFASAIGFRAGIANSFPFFNLKTNLKRPLLLQPFQIMDVTLKDYLKLNCEEAVIEIDKIKKSIQEVNGEFVSLFHNSSLTDSGEWKNWMKVYLHNLS